MKKVLLSLAAVGLLGASGCADTSSLESDIASQQTQIAKLQTSIDEMGERDTKAPVKSNDDVSALIARVEAQEKQLEAARKRIAELEKRGPVIAKASDPNAKEGDEGEVVANEKDYEVYKANREKYEAEQRKKREEANAKRMDEMAELAKEYDIPFDKEDPRGSMMRVMRDPELRAKAFDAFRDIRRKERDKRLGLDEVQSKNLADIETRSRQRVTDAVSAARERGATPEEIAQEVEQINTETKNEVQGILTADQFKQYEEEGGSMGGMGGMMEGMRGMFPGGFGGGGQGR